MSIKLEQNKCFCHVLDALYNIRSLNRGFVSMNMRLFSFISRLYIHQRHHYHRLYGRSFLLHS